MKKLEPLWKTEKEKDFGKVAIEYAAGEDVVLDQQLIQYDCLTLQAHIVMLAKTKILDGNTAKAILEVLEEVKALDKKGKFKLKKELEDVHSNIEHYVLEKLGVEMGGNLRLGIARNDQVYTDTKMYMRDKIIMITKDLLAMIRGFAKTSSQNTETIMPGYSHLRISQPITYAHWLTAKAYHFLDDVKNLLYDYGFLNKCPLGIVEMAGTYLPINREMMAKLLGFDNVSKHSLYTANQRGEIEAKLLADLSLLAMHIRRTINEVIIFSTQELGFLVIDDLYTTGGTAQPNLKNPDTLEVIRANCPRVYSNFLETISMMDIQTSGYSRDTQQTKPSLFEGIKIIEETVPVFAGIMTSLKLNKEKMEKTAELNFATAPDIVTQIAVKGGVSFREAYNLVKALINEGYLKKSFAELTPKLLREVSQKVLGKKIKLNQQDLDAISGAKACTFSHTSEGGPAPSEVKKMISEIKKEAVLFKKQILDKQAQVQKAYQKLEDKVKKIIKEKV